MLFLISNSISAQIDTLFCLLNNKGIKTNTKDLFVLEKPEFPTPEKKKLYRRLML